MVEPHFCIILEQNYTHIYFHFWRKILILNAYLKIVKEAFQASNWSNTFFFLYTFKKIQNSVYLSVHSSSRSRKYFLNDLKVKYNWYWYIYWWMYIIIYMYLKLIYIIVYWYELIYKVFSYQTDKLWWMIEDMKIMGNHGGQTSSVGARGHYNLWSKTSNDDKKRKKGRFVCGFI